MNRLAVYADIEPLRWENGFFGVNSAKLVFDQAAPLVTPERLSVYQVVQAKVAAHCPHLADALASLGFRLVEGEIDCSVPVSPDQRTAATAGGLAIRRAEAGDIAVLRHLAEESFALSRFREPWYAAQDSRRFYAQWAENGVLGCFDHLCLVAAAPAILGMVTLREMADGEARIGLLAVDPASRGQGIGRALISAALDWCRNHQKTRLRVATQAGNLAALRLYIGSGATIDSVAYWLYR